jgi:hypothetical protein
MLMSFSISSSCRKVEFQGKATVRSCQAGGEKKERRTVSKQSPQEEKGRVSFFICRRCTGKRVGRCMLCIRQAYRERRLLFLQNEEQTCVTRFSVFSEEKRETLEREKRMTSLMEHVVTKEELRGNSWLGGSK